MKTYITIFCILLAGMLHAQDWQHISTPGRTLFIDEAGNIKVTEADSLRAFSPGDTVFYSFRTIKAHNNQSCYDTSGGALMGPWIHKMPDGWIHFLNYMNDTLSLNALASLNSSWRFGKITADTYIRATVTALGTDSVLGQYDSVKTITLQAKNSLGQNISHPLNNKTLVLSKHFGLTKMIDLDDFPDDTTGYTLAGRTMDSLGLPEITAADIYDFEVGDQFHISINSELWDYELNQNEIKTVTGKQILSPGLIRYTMHRCMLKIETYFYNPDYVIDTTWLNRDSIVDINLDSLNMLDLYAAAPDEFLSYISTFTSRLTADLYYWKRGQLFNGRSIKAYRFHDFDKNENTGCWQGTSPVFIEYASGLGMTKWAWYEGTGVYCNNNLVYYKKGNETWGTPVAQDCSALLSSGDIHETRVTVAPNPLRTYSRVTFRPSLPAEGLKIRIFDITGRMVMEDDFLPPEYIINRGTLSNGIYLLQIVGKDGNPLGKVKLIID